MIWVGFAVLFCVLSAVPAYFSICRNRNPERLVLMTLAANILLFYLCCAFHLANTGFMVILAANFAFLIPVIRQLRREPAAWKRFFTPAISVYFMLIPILFAATYFLKISGWDEFSHWGFASKLLCETGKMNCEFDYCLEHASYPPGIPLTFVFIHKCISRFFSENLIYFANLLAILTIFLSFVSDQKERGNIPVRLCGMLAGCLLLFFQIDNWIVSVYSEPLLIPMGALILFRVFTSDESIFDDLELMILLMLMILVKSSAMGIIVFALLFYLIRVWKHRGSRITKWQKFLPVLVCIAPFLVKAVWSLLLKFHHTSIVFPVTVSWSEAVRTLCTDSFTAQIAWAMCREFCKDPTLYRSLSGLIAVAVWYCLKGKNKPAEWKMLFFIFMPVFFLTMMFSLLTTYLFIFSRFQAEHLVSFSRYTITFLGILMLLQLFLLFREKTLQNSESRLFKIVLYMVIAGCLWCTFFSLEKNHFGAYSKWRQEADTMRYTYGPVIKPEEKFTVLCREGNGMKNYIYRYFFPDNFTPVQWFNPVLPDKKPKLYQTHLSPDQLLENLNKTTADYVLLDNMDKTFFKDYKAIFADGDDGYQQQALYRITPAGLKYIPPAE